MKIVRSIGMLPALTASVLFLTGCAIGPGGGGTGGSGSVAPPDGVIAAPGQVVGQGTVIQTGDAPPQFCLGPVMESYPPQCSGPELAGWNWDAVDGEEVSDAVTFGTYAIWGTWDGTVFTAEDSVMLALYDPIREVDPLLELENAGDTSESDLSAIQDELTDSASFPFLSMGQTNGYLFVEVIYDDGSIQSWVDHEFLPDAVVIRSALRDIS